MRQVYDRFVWCRWNWSLLACQSHDAGAHICVRHIRIKASEIFFKEIHKSLCGFLVQNGSDRCQNLVVRCTEVIG